MNLWKIILYNILLFICNNYTEIYGKKTDYDSLIEDLDNPLKELKKNKKDPTCKDHYNHIKHTFQWLKREEMKNNSNPLIIEGLKSLIEDFSFEKSSINFRSCKSLFLEYFDLDENRDNHTRNFIENLK